MKLFLEADFTKGNGAIRWEGVTMRRLKRYTYVVIGVVIGALVLLAQYGNGITFSALIR